MEKIWVTSNLITFINFYLFEDIDLQVFRKI